MGRDEEAEAKHRATRATPERDGLEERRIDAAIGGGNRERRKSAGEEEAAAGSFDTGERKRKGEQNPSSKSVWSSLFWGLLVLIIGLNLKIHHKI